MLGVSTAKTQSFINMKCLCVLGCWSCRYLGYHKHFQWQETYGAFGKLCLNNKYQCLFCKIILSGGGKVGGWQGREELPGEKNPMFLVSFLFFQFYYEKLKEYYSE